jgi:hypothetical protein
MGKRVAFSDLIDYNNAHMEVSVSHDTGMQLLMEVSPSGYGSGLLNRDSQESRGFESHHFRRVLTFR